MAKRERTGSHLQIAIEPLRRPDWAEVAEDERNKVA